MSPLDFIEVARLLAASQNSEAAMRSAVSRAYYGALHNCNECVPKDFAPKAEEFVDASSHRAIIDAMERWGRQLVPRRTEAQQAARLISKLKRLRVQADYKVTTEWDVDASACIATAEKIVQLTTDASGKYCSRENG
ncbi:hypothetical protein [Burkholderia oklahomensis]|uniref:HEPN domain-containing protein n=1 Tax=Burkholderia oklahomensis TaxID=342113 RepID=A0AAI8B4G6_9BURK|nr:hypothetical protein [Burkholderia oklahomensis]AIO65406.1 hypothetical protein DM82_1178 [Burkholderia oklahomensis]AOI42547.1 hypothetical protein WG70_23485 [Burkholderia oklahomensis EO147]KUY59051.1 hypothetical protein WG70_07400 [Burkholderia oklahomensis EO147]QPS37273.1 hypothetical protein I6G57_18815 [Burkholderia oklahomensis]